MNFTLRNMIGVGASPEDTKRARILQGAMEVFLAYGFQRTTMDDIARAAEISRPALYLLFRNKSDIYRALAESFLEMTIGRAAEALSEPLPLQDRLSKALDGALCAMAEVENSPHGAEILDMKNSLAADIAASGRARLGRQIAAAIEECAVSSGCPLGAADLSAQRLADMLLDAIDGMKLRGLPAAEQNAAASAYIRVVAGAVDHAGTAAPKSPTAI